jgi:hypothetical protein
MTSILMRRSILKKIHSSPSTQISIVHDQLSPTPIEDIISYKAAAEVVRRGSISNLGFTRADLMNFQDIYGSPAAYQIGHGANKTASPPKNYPIPLQESVEQELQVDLFFFLGQVFFMSISVLLGLIMVIHLGPGIDRSSTDRQGEKSKSKHIRQYQAKGIRIKRVTSDGEPSIRAAKQDLESSGIELNILGRGSHTPHAESAIRHIKNKARSIKYSHRFPLAS